MTGKFSLLALLLLLVLAGSAYAAKPSAKHAASKPPATPVESIQLQKCLKRADELPDIAAAEAGAWIKQGGGDEAHLCRAFAQSNRGMHADAAREFWALASKFKKRDPQRAGSMHDLAGQEFLRAKDPQNASEQFSLAIKLTPKDPANYIGRAASDIAVEKYWDAVGDLNHALKIDPANIDALRQRGLAWLQLGNAKNAQEDLSHAAQLSGDQPVANPAPAK